MRQVPRYAIIGNGRVAKHLAYYFQLLQIPYQQWHRQLTAALSASIAEATHVLILIKDAEIDPFIDANKELQAKILIHCSGALQSQYAYSCHPLMTFSTERYELKQYQQIAFILGETAPDFNDLFPQLSNPWCKIPEKKRAFYHALCVMANNFTTILWQKFFNDLQQQFNIPKAVALPFLQQTLHNLQQDHQHCLSGPLARNDMSTINNNQQALASDPFLDVYRAFVHAYTQSQ